MNTEEIKIDNLESSEKKIYIILHKKNLIQLFEIK